MIDAVNLTTLASDMPMTSEDIVKLVAVGGGVLFGIIWMISSSWRRASQTSEREKTRREIAAYVAEGSISPEDAATLLAQGDSESLSQIAAAVASGKIKPEKAEALLRAARGGRSESA